MEAYPASSRGCGGSPSQRNIGRRAGQRSRAKAHAKRQDRHRLRRDGIRGLAGLYDRNIECLEIVRRHRARDRRVDLVTSVVLSEENLDHADGMSGDLCSGNAEKKCLSHLVRHLGFGQFSFRSAERIGLKLKPSQPRCGHSRV